MTAVFAVGGMPAKKGLLGRLADGPVLCAEGYLFELERRGYLQAGAFVPEAVIENPDVVRRLHEDFVHAGCQAPFWAEKSGAMKSIV